MFLSAGALLLFLVSIKPRAGSWVQILKGTLDATLGEPRYDTTCPVYVRIHHGALLLERTEVSHWEIPSLGSHARREGGGERHRGGSKPCERAGLIGCLFNKATPREAQQHEAEDSLPRGGGEFCCSCGGLGRWRIQGRR